MAIGSVIQQGSTILVFDENGRQLPTLFSGSGSGDGLQGYTASTVSVREGSFIKVYDERGRQLSAVYAGSTNQNSQQIGFDFSRMFHRRVARRGKLGRLFDYVEKMIVRGLIFGVILFAIYTYFIQN
jgi:hypothetical protein